MTSCFNELEERNYKLKNSFFCPQPLLPAPLSSPEMSLPSSQIKSLCPLLPNPGATISVLDLRLVIFLIPSGKTNNNNNKSNLRKEAFTSAHSPREQSIMVGTAWRRDRDTGGHAGYI